MMLRESVKQTGQGHDLRAVTGRGEVSETGVAHGDVLVALAEAVVSGDERVLAPARSAAQDALGEAGFVDAAGVAGFFNAIDRVADATGTQMDERTVEATGDLREDLGIHEYYAIKERLDADRSR